MNTRKPQDHLAKGGFLRQFPEVISGAEETGTETGTEPPKGTEGAPAPKENEEEEEESEQEEQEEDTKGLKSALAKERAAAKAATRALTKLQKEQEARELSEKTEVEQANIKATKAEEKATKLAAGLLKRDIDSAIRKAAAEHKFIDMDDVLEVIDRSAITAEQDDDDPSDITIDEKSVKKAVEALAKKKPHWVSQGTDDGEATGGKFGGAPQKKKTGDEALREIYPSLRPGATS